MEYSFFKLDVNNPTKSLVRINEMARNGWRILAVIPDGQKALVMLERDGEVSVTKEPAQKCQGMKADKSPCGAYAVTGSDYCIAHQNQAHEQDLS